MKKKLIRAGIFILVWIVVTVVFEDYFPTNPHIGYITLMSPFIILAMLVLDFTEVITNFPIDFLPGVLFWVVLFVLLYFPRKTNQSQNNKTIVEDE